ncbi:MAG: amidohydrolase family protein [Gemmatimonadetes bacterium]|nr:amidohydrolase family protein [Gemmatimonadota bacterium]
MPEPAAWRYDKITKPMFDVPAEHVILVGRVLTMAGDVFEDGFVEMMDGEITAVGERGRLGAGDAAGEAGAAGEADTAGEAGVVVEHTGGTIMPGLINSHAHLNWDGIHDLARQSMDDPRPISAFKAAANMLKSVRAGVTMVRDLGFHDMNLFSKQAVAQGIFPGPRLKVCGAAIIQTGGHTYWVCREASGADEMRRAVREQVRGGADLIKIMACHDTLEFTDEELAAVIDEAHRNGLPVTAHATYDACIERVARFGVDCIEHGGSMSEETVALLLEKEIPIVTTFAPLVQQSQPDIARRFGIPEWKIEERKKAVADPTRYEGLVRAARAGVSIVFGTDAGSPAVEHDVIAPELAHMVKVGVCENALDALASITVRAAKVSRMEHLVGTLEEGKAADVIVVDGRPDEDLFALDRVQTTFVEGRRMHG